MKEHGGDYAIYLSQTVGPDRGKTMLEIKVSIIRKSTITKPPKSLEMVYAQVYRFEFNEDFLASQSAPSLAASFRICKPPILHCNFQNKQPD